MCCRGEVVSPKPVDPSVFEALEYLVSMYNQVHTGDRCNTQAGHWINEAFVVRLVAVLEAHHVVGRGKVINQALSGWRRVDLCRRLRNKFAHATGKIRSSDSRRLDEDVKAEFCLDEQQSIFGGHFILSKDTVLQPMLEACTHYAQALLELEANELDSPAGS